MWWLPLEIIDKRYTKLTREWFSNEFNKHRIQYAIIEGIQSNDKINVGSFLDVFGTIKYKSSQIEKLADLFAKGKIQNNDTFFIDDIWMPGLPGIKYMANMSGIDVNIYGIYHAGSNIPSDDVAVKIGQNNWVKTYEQSLIDMCNGIFVGSEYHKQNIESYHDKKFNNIHATGIAYKPNYVKQQIVVTNSERENIVLFPHRIHPEKHPEIFDKLEKAVTKTRPDIKFIKTMEQNLSKQELYNLMYKSKLIFSAADQENFGYATLEGATLGCDLLLPNKNVYPEFYSNDCIYECNTPINILSNIVITKIDNFWPCSHNVLEWVDKSVDRMINIMYSQLPRPKGRGLNCEIHRKS